jgi:hypothetical protein
MIRIHRTYAIVTPESAEDGEAADSGFLSENESVSFRELVSIMRDYCVPSCSRPSGSPRDWLSTHPSQDYRDCSETTESLHFSRQNSPRMAKYWRKAMVFAGIIE